MKRNCRVPQKIRVPGFYEGHIHPGGEHPELLKDYERDGYSGSGQSLESQFSPRGQPEVARVDALDEVIRETEGAERGGGKYGVQADGIARMGPQYCGRQNADRSEPRAE